MQDTPDNKYYKAPDYYHMESSGSLHILPHFGTCQQTEEYTCAAACALMILRYFGNDGYTEEQLAGQMGSTPGEGTPVEAVRKFFTDLGWEVESHEAFEKRFPSEEEFISFLKERIARGIPVMTDWLDWGGHWQVIIGIDTEGIDSVHDDVLILADPCDATDHCRDGYYTYPASRFFSMWREGSGTKERGPYIQPFVAAHPNSTAG